MRRRGGKLGRPQNFTDAHRRANGRRASAPNRRRALEWRAAVVPVIEELRDAGHTLAEVAAQMNKRGMRTRTGKPWTLANVERLAADR